MASSIMHPSTINETLGPYEPYKYDTTIGPTALDNEPTPVNKPIINPLKLNSY